MPLLVELADRIRQMEYARRYHARGVMEDWAELAALASTVNVEEAERRCPSCGETCHACWDGRCPEPKREVWPAHKRERKCQMCGLRCHECGGASCPPPPQKRRSAHATTKRA